jgi:DNA-binding PadR family transcriptional regulator
MSRASDQSALALAILGLISIEPSSGYDLRKVFSTTPMGHFSSSPGAIYPALQRLEEAGLIKGRVEKKDSLRPRRVYVLTKKGMDELKARLAHPVTEDDVIWRLEELMLRFAFMGDVLGRNASVEFLQELLPLVRAYVRKLQKHLKNNRSRMTINGVYAVEQGIAKYAVTARWAKRVIDELQTK